MRTDLEKNIKGCLNDDRLSHFKLFEKYQKQMLRVVSRYAKDSSEADEMLQIGFIKVFKNLHKYRNTGVFAGWLRRIFINTAIDYLRRKKINKNVFIGDDYKLDLLSNKFNFGEASTITLDSKLITDAINKLSHQYKMVFNLFVVEDYSHKEISEILNISEGTSKSNLFKAKANLKEVLQPHYNNALA